MGSHAVIRLRRWSQPGVQGMCVLQKMHRPTNNGIMYLRVFVFGIGACPYEIETCDRRALPLLTTTNRNSESFFARRPRPFPSPR
jgi:hypothetical protein